MNADTCKLPSRSWMGFREMGNVKDRTRLPSPKVSSASSVNSKRRRNRRDSLSLATWTPYNQTSSALRAIDYHSGKLWHQRKRDAALRKRAQRDVDADRFPPLKTGDGHASDSDAVGKLILVEAPVLARAP